jgi:hypothetical protein
MNPNAIIAMFMNEERTLTFELQASGDLVQIDRADTSDVWSPPRVVARLSTATEEIKSLLLSLSEADPLQRRADEIYAADRAEDFNVGTEA